MDGPIRFCWWRWPCFPYFFFSFSLHVHTISRCEHLVWPQFCILRKLTTIGAMHASDAHWVLLVATSLLSLYFIESLALVSFITYSQSQCTLDESNSGVAGVCVCALRPQCTRHNSNQLQCSRTFGPLFIPIFVFFRGRRIRFPSSFHSSPLRPCAFRLHAIFCCCYFGSYRSILSMTRSIGIIIIIKIDTNARGALSIAAVVVVVNDVAWQCVPCIRAPCLLRHSSVLAHTHTPCNYEINFIYGPTDFPHWSRKYDWRHCQYVMFQSLWTILSASMRNVCCQMEFIELLFFGFCMESLTLVHCQWTCRLRPKIQFIWSLPLSLSSRARALRSEWA